MLKRQALDVAAFLGFICIASVLGIMAAMALGLM